MRDNMTYHASLLKIVPPQATIKKWRYHISYDCDIISKVN